MDRDALCFLRRIKRKLHKYRIEYEYFRYLHFPFGKKYYILGTPTHANIGDSAIALAEKLYLVRSVSCAERVKEMSFYDVNKYRRFLPKNNNPRCHFFWHGGGNMGDQWFTEEALRQKYIIERRNCKLVIFPQTFYYSDTEAGQQKLKDSIPVYNNHDLTIVTREKTSYERIQKVYPRANNILLPDIVLSTSMEDYGVVPEERSGVLFVARSDPEKAVPDSTWEALERVILKAGKACHHTDMYSDCRVTKENRKECVRLKMQEFCRAKLVITDRLHGMIFAAITETPCIVFSNYNYKVKGTYEWIRYLPYIRYVESLEEAEQAVPELLSMNDCKYDNTPLMPLFNALAEEVNGFAPNHRHRSRL